MKKKVKLFAVLLTVVLVAGAGIFYACEKTKDSVKMDFSEIDKISAEIGEFHTYAMTKFIDEVSSSKDIVIVDQNYINKLTLFFEKEMLNYDFKHLKLDDYPSNFSDIYDYSTYQKICSTIKKGYDFSVFSSIENTSNTKATVMLATSSRIVTPNYILIEKKCKNIENKMESLVTINNTFKEVQTAYLKFITEELKDVTNINDYTYLRYYADVYISSFEYWVDYYSKNGAKGWLRDTWNKVKEGVAVDAGGAVAGGIYGAYTGAAAGSVVGGVGAAPGVVAGMASGAVVGACATSAGWAVTKLVSGN